MILSEVPTQGINDSTCAAEKKLVLALLNQILNFTLNFTLQWWWELLVCK